MQLLDGRAWTRPTVTEFESSNLALNILFSPRKLPFPWQLLTLGWRSLATLMIYIQCDKAAEKVHGTFPRPKAECLDQDHICPFLGVPTSWSCKVEGQFSQWSVRLIFFRARVNSYKPVNGAESCLLILQRMGMANPQQAEIWQMGFMPLL